ncbi:MAG: ethanolamine utilization protein EutJ [Clostridia bacterium]|nr:ethanolamine utilization protein EutJ [Clostridia bacterium]
MDNLQHADELIRKFQNTLANPLPVKKGKKLYTGVDLGTAYIVLSVIDEDGIPVAGAMQFAQVVKDGIVVDYMGALDIVRELKTELENRLERELKIAGAAFPPGTEEGVQKTITYVVEGSGMEVVTMIDEPTAANNVLGVTDGAVVDIGGGTTGTAILKDGEVVYVADDPTGGTHLSLVIAGAYNITFEEAEKIKKDPEKQKELLPVVKPVMQKMGSIIKKHIQDHDVDVIYLAGGTSCFPGIDKIIEKEVNIPVSIPVNPFLVTPLGIALSVLGE